MTYQLVIEDDDGTFSLPILPTMIGDGSFYPPHWLGPHHPTLERFRYELQVHGLDDPLEAEAWARNWVQEANRQLTDGLMSIFNYEVHKDASPDDAQPAPQLPAPNGSGQ